MPALGRPAAPLSKSVGKVESNSNSLPSLFPFFLFSLFLPSPIRPPLILQIGQGMRGGGLGAPALDGGAMRQTHTNCGVATWALPFSSDTPPSALPPVTGKPPKLFQIQIYSIDKSIDSIH